ncbi:hypothetical protein BRARA_K01668 [Brassica rapa]|uniref:TTF-type domain-containing protein n=1 Tax=Brassica campestris TaxID=3711 RepID=A0A397KVD7_BRACM|nr:hypothetical protein BRARA_K01668 [Brassica rapa]
MERYYKKASVSPSDNTSPYDNIDDLPWDPAKRKSIKDYHANQVDEVRRKYLLRGPCQPLGHNFEKKLISGKMRRFNPAWFELYGNWLEYSVSEEKAYCLCCYLFRDDGYSGFVKDRFSSWNKPDRLSFHVGDFNSSHNNAVKKCDDLMNQGQSIVHALYKKTTAMKNEYRIRLNASIDVSRYLLRQGLAFREIQKDIVNAFAEEVVKSVIEEIDNGVFDESADVSDKEQMGVVFRFVDKNGAVKERFVGVVHVKETSSLSLKHAIDELFAKYGLSLKKVRGQGYDGASNMKGEFNGLRSLIFRENNSAYYVHCFAHQLQLVVVAVAKKIFDIADFFDMVSTLLNVVGASCKRMWPGTTRWGSHYKTLLRLVGLFSTIIKVLEYIEVEGADDSKRRQAYGLLKYVQTFDCVFYMHLMLLILGICENLSMALQNKDQDILNAMSLVESTKRELQRVRDDGWDSLMLTVSSFCKKHDTEMLNMDEGFIDSRKPRKKTNITNMHHYKVNCFNAALDLQLQEFNDRFTEVNTELLTCMASLNPVGAFRGFDKSKLVKLAKFYPDDFSFMECISLEQQLGIFIDNVRHDQRFKDLKILGDLALMMVETQKHIAHPLVYRLLKLVLTLPVATASVERCFSAMKLVKTALRNRMGDHFLSDYLICFIEKELLDDVTNEEVLIRFQAVSERRMHL